MPPRSRRSFTSRGLSTFEEAVLNRTPSAIGRQSQAEIYANFAASRARSAAREAASSGGYSQRYADNAVAQARTASPGVLQAWAAGRDPVYAAAARPILAVQATATPAAANLPNTPRAAGPQAARTASS